LPAALLATGGWLFLVGIAHQDPADAAARERVEPGSSTLPASSADRFRGGGGFSSQPASGRRWSPTRWWPPRSISWLASRQLRPRKARRRRAYPGVRLDYPDNRNRADYRALVPVFSLIPAVLAHLSPPPRNPGVHSFSLMSYRPTAFCCATKRRSDKPISGGRAG
jgi:hypothetical protein